MSYDYSCLFQPININGMRLRNRITMSPMGTFTPMVDGTESEEGIRYYEERAKGGIGLIQTGSMFLNEVVAQSGPTLAMDNMRSVPKGTVLVERVHRWGAKISMSLSAGTGRNGMPNIGELVPISSSAIPSYYNPEQICRPLSIEEIKKMIGKTPGRIGEGNLQIAARHFVPHPNLYHGAVIAVYPIEK